MDIRNFFGGGGAKKPAPPAPQSTKPTSESRVKSPSKGSPEKRSRAVPADDEDVIVDSDDDFDQEASRKRLMTKRAKEQKPVPVKSKHFPAASETRKASADGGASISSPSPSSRNRSPVKGKQDVPIDVDLTDPESQSQALEDNTTQAFAAEVSLTPASSTSKPTTKLQVLKKNAAGTNLDALRPVEGGAAAFFGSAGDSKRQKIDEPSTTSKDLDKFKAPSSPSKAVGKETVQSPAGKSPVKTQVSSASKSAFVYRGGARAPPLNGGNSAPLPEGRPDCLSGIKIAVTGVLENYAREQIEDLIMTYGGKTVTSISGKTDFVVIGTVLDDGRPVTDSSKYKTALEKKIPILTEAEFIAKIVNSKSEMVSTVSRGQSVTKVSAAEDKIVSSITRGLSQTTPSKHTAPVASSSSSSSSSASAASIVPSHGSTKVSIKKSETPTVEDRLWVDKYKPQSVDQLIGSGDVAKKLLDWVRRWDDVHLRKTVKIPHSNENPGAKAALLSGPPGIGKTSVATLVAHQLGFDVVELNASDTRNAKSVTEQLSDVVLSKAMNQDGSVSKRLVIMDEVDGMGGSDRGGIQELIKVIKSSKNPIICICNDRQAQKIKSLANHCFDLRCRRPTKTQIASRMIAIGKSEGLDIEQNAAEMLVEQVGNDIRQVLHSMQMWRAQSSSMKYLDMKDKMKTIEKDKVLRQTPFDACLSILGGNKLPLDERYNSFFIDYSLLPLMVQHNYIDSSKSGIFRQPGLDEGQMMDKLSEAADACSDMDLSGSMVRGQDQHWELLPTQAAMAVRVGSIVRGFQAFPAFPSWLGKFSTTSKNKRLVQELAVHTSLSIRQGFTPMRLEYAPFLRQALLRPLLDKGADGVPEVVNMLDEYGLSKEDFMESLKGFQFVLDKDPNLKDAYEAIDPKTKAALTRYYNSLEHSSQALVSEQAIAKKGKRAAGRGGDDGDEVFDEEDGDKPTVEEEPEEDAGDASAFMRKQPAQKSKGKVAAADTSSSRAAPAKKARK